MMIARIHGFTRMIGEEQGYRGLPIRDEIREMKMHDKDRSIIRIPAMVSAWEPTPDELERLNKGAKIHLILCGGVHPPVLLEVGNVHD
jgi:hypothetical protein